MSHSSSISWRRLGCHIIRDVIIRDRPEYLKLHPEKPVWRWEHPEIEVFRVDIFSVFFLWFWGMAFSKALATTWLNNFLGTFFLEYFQVKIKQLCAGKGFSQNMVSKFAYRTYFQIWMMLRLTLHVHKLSSEQNFWKKYFFAGFLSWKSLTYMEKKIWDGRFHHLPDSITFFWSE